VVQVRWVKADMISWPGWEMRSWWSKMFQLSSAIPVARWNTPWRLQEIDAIIKDFFAGRLLAKPLAAGEDAKGKSPPGGAGEAGDVY